MMKIAILANLLFMPLGADSSTQDGRGDPGRPAIIVAKSPIEIRTLERPINFPEGTSGFGVGPFRTLTDGLNNQTCDEGLRNFLRSEGKNSPTGTIYIWIYNTHNAPPGRKLADAVRNLRDALPEGRTLVIFLTGFPKDAVPQLPLPK